MLAASPSQTNSTAGSPGRLTPFRRPLPPPCNIQVLPITPRDSAASIPTVPGLIAEPMATAGDPSVPATAGRPLPTGNGFGTPASGGLLRASSPGAGLPITTGAGCSTLAAEV